MIDPHIARLLSLLPRVGSVVTFALPGGIAPWRVGCVSLPISSHPGGLVCLEHPDGEHEECWQRLTIEEAAQAHRAGRCAAGPHWSALSHTYGAVPLWPVSLDPDPVTPSDVSGRTEDAGDLPHAAANDVSAPADGDLAPSAQDVRLGTRVGQVVAFEDLLEGEVGFDEDEALPYGVRVGRGGWGWLVGSDDRDLDYAWPSTSPASVGGYGTPEVETFTMRPCSVAARKVLIDGLDPLGDASRDEPFEGAAREVKIIAEGCKTRDDVRRAIAAHEEAQS